MTSRQHVYRHAANPLASTPLHGGGHDWTAQGRYEDGDERLRCTRCHAHDRMPLATQICVRMPR